jgi:hypothetical protein
MKIIIYIFIGALIVGTAGCKKDYLETKPSNAVTIDEIFQHLNTTYAALNGAYKEQFASGVGASTGHDNFGQKANDLEMDLMGNDMVVHSQGYGWFNSSYTLTGWMLATDGSLSDNAWYRYFDIIKQANIMYSRASNLAGDVGVSQSQIDLIKGQALGLRAYCYYYLINMFQQTYKGNEAKKGIPIYTQPTSQGKGRSTVDSVYKQIVADLTEAETLLTGKTRASKVNIDVTVVQGFRARTALIMGDWATAATYAKKARTGYTLMTTTGYIAAGAFSTISNAEWMWGSYIPADQATIYASFFSHMDVRRSSYAQLGTQKKITKWLYDQMPAGDVRKTLFRTPGTGTSSNPDYNQLKHLLPNPASWAGDYLYMRASEMYLIEAEAQARLGNDGDARTALETLLKNRNPSYSAAEFSGTSLVNEILLQRRLELWGEGFSLIDIKRLNQGLNRPTGAGNHGAPSLDPAVYTTSPEDPRFIMRVPQRELNNNPNMSPADQNPS